MNLEQLDESDVLLMGWLILLIFEVIFLSLYVLFSGDIASVYYCMILYYLSKLIILVVNSSFLCPTRGIFIRFCIWYVSLSLSLSLSHMVFPYFEIISLGKVRSWSASAWWRLVPVSYYAVLYACVHVPSMPSCLNPFLFDLDTS